MNMYGLGSGVGKSVIVTENVGRVDVNPSEVGSPRKRKIRIDILSR
jgi:hypothetical protein